YHNPLDRRYYSQTNSCPDCAVEMQWHENGETTRPFTDLEKVLRYWQEGKILAIKGIGGYLLTCDATNEEAVSRLRRLKRRPSKPFALMYPSLEILVKDTELTEAEKEALLGTEAPIVLLKKRKHPATPLAEAVAPGLDTLGVMLPYTPLFDLLLTQWGKPVVATSGNVSGDVIVYEDERAMEQLDAVADALLMNNRRIVVPQDDSVLRFAGNRRIFLRRSRGYAPVYMPVGEPLPADRSIAGTGAMLKSGFTFLHRGNLYVSQYLGDTSGYDASRNYIRVWNHLRRLLDFKPREIVADKHPDYFSTRFARERAEAEGARLYFLQHHKAHFVAVLAENNLLDTSEPIMGVIWDGTGYGDDGRIWGGEFFLYRDRGIRRIAHFGYFPLIAGDKMMKEPRLSLFSLAGDHGFSVVREKFTSEEWRIYRRLKEKTSLQTCGAGRLFDAAASLILGIDRQTYEGEAAVRLEGAARRYFEAGGDANRPDLILPSDSTAFPRALMRMLVEMREGGKSPEEMAATFHVALVRHLLNKAREAGIRHIAFSGGVWQNALLTRLVEKAADREITLYFHRQLSPNDENISFGQVMWRLGEIHAG
ncbi:MAG: carbamoyltransferase HypF, partial [Chlorobi bacterium]|nr:carbamoyltransferase HypF [Chlorobiota bacterium]